MSDTASLQADENMAVLDAHARDGYGYLYYWGLDQSALTVGDPESPAVVSETEFPAGSGVPLDQFRQALVEFVTSGGDRPSAVQWQDLP